MINQKTVRNFAILSHIDHGKSTLSDRFLELTGAVSPEKMRPQYLDMMDLERERGITIKMQPVRMAYTLNAVPYILNLIDTPGHVDFSYEVSRALAAVDGAILLVDASKGVQAQTLSNLELAKKQGLVIIPAVNKIDLFTPYHPAESGIGAGPHPRIEETVQELANILRIDKEEIIKISAKTGANVDSLLKLVVARIPPPGGGQNNPLRALIFDSNYDPYKGVIAYVKIVDGKIKANDKIYLLQERVVGEVKELGYFTPEPIAQEELNAGEIGYIATGIKEMGRVRVGDTIISLKFKVQSLKLPEALPGYKTPKPMVFASFYPEDPNDFELLKDSLSKLKLNDASLVFELETQESIGRGFRCGFLGSLHAEIISERLHREFGLNLVISSPQVIYKVIDKKNEERLIFSASKWPNPSEIKESQEPWIRLEIITPLKYFGQVSGILRTAGGNYLDKKYLGADRVILIYEIPLRAILVSFYDNLKGATQGYASMNYTVLGFRPAVLVKLEILIAGGKEEAFSKIVPEKEAFQEGRKIVSRLKQILPHQLFSVPLQAAISGKIIARETIRAKGRDVTASLYGGDYTRKRKLLERQKKGKKELKEKGKVRIPTNVFLEVMRG